MDKLTILADAAKYDAACTSSGLDRGSRPQGMGTAMQAGCCHSFSADGRCISLLKVLMSNTCVYDCQYCVKRVFYSAYMPVSNSKLLPAPQEFKPPLLREHRLYQADWLLRFYHFEAHELLDEQNPNFNPLVDPKCSWALSHMEFFPVEVNRADYEALLRVPGVGVKSARRILAARRCGPLHFEGLKKLGVVLKRAQYFLTCNGRMTEGLRVRPDGVLRHLVAMEKPMLAQEVPEQLCMFEHTG